MAEHPAATEAAAESQRTSPRTRTELATAAVVDIAQRHAPGTRLGTKEMLRKECGVSVGTFNEALALAQSRGYISLKPGPGGGVFVNEQSAIARLGNSMISLDTAEPSISDAIRIRDALDPLLIADAIASAASEDFAAMRTCLRGMRTGLEGGDHLSFVRENWNLHRVIAEASPSWILRSMYLTVLEMLQNHTIGLASVPEEGLPEYAESRFDLHERLVGALEDRDEPLAQELIRIHNLSGKTGSS